MAISTQDYVKKPNETIEQYNTRIASLRGDTPAELATMNTLSATSVGSNPTINAGVINAPTPQSVTNSVANILSSAAGTPQYVQGLQQQQADLLKMYQDQSQSILAKMQETTNQPNVSITDELKKLQEQYGIPDYLDKISALAPEITAIQEKINAINQREAQAIENLRGKAISEFTAQGQEAALKRQAAIERSGYAAELGIKQAMVESYKGNITQARSLISDAVQAYTFDIQQKNDDMDRMYKFYGDFIGQLDKNTQNQLSIVRDELATERERQIKDANTIGEMMLQYPNSGIKFSDTVQQATVKAQPEAASRLSVPNVSELLSPTEAVTLGVPYGTTKNQAAILNIIPTSQKQKDTIKTLSKADIIISQIEKSIGGLNLSSSPILSTARGLILNAGALAKTNTNAVAYKSLKEGLLAQLARASGEVGVLTDQDINRARSLLPTFYDTKETANVKINQLKSFFSDLKSSASGQSIYNESNNDPFGIM